MVAFQEWNRKKKQNKTKQKKTYITKKRSFHTD